MEPISEGVLAMESISDHFSFYITRKRNTKKHAERRKGRKKERQKERRKASK